MSSSDESWPNSSSRRTPSGAVTNGRRRPLGVEAPDALLVTASLKVRLESSSVAIVFMFGGAISQGSFGLGRTSAKPGVLLGRGILSTNRPSITTRSLSGPGGGNASLNSIAWSGWLLLLGPDGNPGWFSSLRDILLPLRNPLWDISSIEVVIGIYAWKRGVRLELGWA